jgi:hypothetical protein
MSMGSHVTLAGKRALTRSERADVANLRIEPRLQKNA